MKIFSTTSLLSCALSLFVQTAIVHGAGSSSSQAGSSSSQEELTNTAHGVACSSSQAGSSSSQQELLSLTPPKICPFKNFPNCGHGPLQTIMEFTENGQNFILAIQNCFILSNANKTEFRRLKANKTEFRRLTHFMNSDSNASSVKVRDARKKQKKILEEGKDAFRNYLPYLTAKFPLHINVIMENGPTPYTLYQEIQICAIKRLSFNEFSFSLQDRFGDSTCDSRTKAAGDILKTSGVITKLEYLVMHHAAFNLISFSTRSSSAC